MQPARRTRLPTTTALVTQHAAESAYTPARASALPIPSLPAPRSPYHQQLYFHSQQHHQHQQQQQQQQLYQQHMSFTPATNTGASLYFAPDPAAPALASHVEQMFYPPSHHFHQQQQQRHHHQQQQQQNYATPQLNPDSSPYPSSLVPAPAPAQLQMTNLHIGGQHAASPDSGVSDTHDSSVTFALPPALPPSPAMLPQIARSPVQPRTTLLAAPNTPSVMFSALALSPRGSKSAQEAGASATAAAAVSGRGAGSAGSTVPAGPASALARRCLPAATPVDGVVDHPVAANRISAITVRWIKVNCVSGSSYHVARTALYAHYMQHCSALVVAPVNSARLGKLLRRVFPGVLTSRVAHGNRNQSKYFYSGVGLRSEIAGRILPRLDLQETLQAADGNPQPSPTVDGDTEMPEVWVGPHRLVEFPTPCFDAMLPQSLPYDQMCEFLLVYRAHLEKLIDNVQTDVDLFPLYASRFWRGAQNAFAGILSSSLVADLTPVCEDILFRSVIAVFAPDPTEPLSSAILRALRLLAKRLATWAAASAETLPPKIGAARIAVARVYGDRFQRITVIQRFAEAIREALSSPESRARVIMELQAGDTASAAQRCQALGITQPARDCLLRVVELVKMAFAPSAFLSEIQRCVGASGLSLPQFTLQWNSLCASLLRECTLRAVTSGPGHMVLQFVTECLLYLGDASRQADAIRATRSRVVHSLCSPEHANELAVFRPLDPSVSAPLSPTNSVFLPSPACAPVPAFVFPAARDSPPPPTNPIAAPAPVPAPVSAPSAAAAPAPAPVAAAAAQPSATAASATPTPTPTPTAGSTTDDPAPSPRAKRNPAAKRSPKRSPAAPATHPTALSSPKRRRATVANFNISVSTTTTTTATAAAEDATDVIIQKASPRSKSGPSTPLSTRQRRRAASTFPPAVVSSLLELNLDRSRSTSDSMLAQSMSTAYHSFAFRAGPSGAVASLSPAVMSAMPGVRSGGAYSRAGAMHGVRGSDGLGGLGPENLYNGSSAGALGLWGFDVGHGGGGGVGGEAAMLDGGYGSGRNLYQSFGSDTLLQYPAQAFPSHHPSMAHGSSDSGRSTDSHSLASASMHAPCAVDQGVGGGWGGSLGHRDAPVALPDFVLGGPAGSMYGGGMSDLTRILFGGLLPVFDESPHCMADPFALGPFTGNNTSLHRPTTSDVSPTTSGVGCIVSSSSSSSSLPQFLPPLPASIGHALALAESGEDELAF